MKRTSAKQLELKLQTANRYWEQMMADVKYITKTSNEQLPDDSAQITEETKPVEIYSFDVLFNGRVKHTYCNADRTKAWEAAQWRAKKGAEAGWPVMIRPTPTAQ